MASHLCSSGPSRSSPWEHSLLGAASAAASITAEWNTRPGKPAPGKEQGLLSGDRTACATCPRGLPWSMSPFLLSTETLGLRWGRMLSHTEQTKASLHLCSHQFCMSLQSQPPGMNSAIRRRSSGAEMCSPRRGCWRGCGWARFPLALRRR